MSFISSLNFLDEDTKLVKFKQKKTQTARSANLIDQNLHPNQSSNDLSRQTKQYNPIRKKGEQTINLGTAG